MAAERTNFDIQYSSSYQARFRQMKGMILDNPAIQEYGLSVLELANDLHSECIVIGTLFLASCLKHSVLSQNKTADRLATRTYVSADSPFYIEDDTGRLEIQFAPTFTKLTAFSSGITLGWIGSIDDRDIFVCTDVIFPVEAAASNKSDASGRVLIIGNTLLDSGNYERIKVIMDLYRDGIDHVILIGDVFKFTEEIPPFHLFNKLADGCAAGISLLPGLNDLTSHLLPIQPFHRLLFGPNAFPENGMKINMLGNPFQGVLLGEPFVILSHHILHDLVKYIPQPEGGLQNTPADYRMHLDESAAREYEPHDYFTDGNMMDILEQLIRIRHIAPNAPDTVGCIPFDDADPFILGECRFLVSSGLKNPSARKYKDKIIIGVPDFNKTGLAVLFDMKTAGFETIECPRF